MELNNIKFKAVAVGLIIDISGSVAVGLTLLVICTMVFANIALADNTTSAKYAGSASCRECHEKFHTLWDTSRHRNSIIPYSDDFSRQKLLPQKAPITIGKYSYLADISPSKGIITETGLSGTKTYKIEQVLGDKDIYAFLTTLDNGRIESLPIGYDIKRKEWYEAENAIDAPAPNGRKKPAVYWQNYPFFVSEACPSCHVSRFAISFDKDKKKYTETWSESGINCETCHGPAAEHNEAMRKVPKGQAVADPKLISVKKMSPARRSDLCVICHAKQNAITDSFTPGDRYFDHYDLTMLENDEFYPDGRDQGEDYTLTSWLQSKCVKDGKPDCIHCHTSSGRYRFTDAAKANGACLPCHSERVKNVANHSHHPANSPGSRCISCHMPKTSYARMQRSDHSMRPPTPAATLEFGSPNACNICHDKNDAAWADKIVRQWYPANYQEAALRPARLIEAARKRDWSKLPEMLTYLRSKERTEVYSASLLRLLRSSKDKRVSALLLEELTSSSPLIRAAAAESLRAHQFFASAKALLKAADDDYRLVRVKAAASLSSFPRKLVSKEAEKKAQRAFGEYRASLLLEPDKSGTWLTVGNYHLKRDEFAEASAAYQAALNLSPRSVQALLNLAYVRHRLGDTSGATKDLTSAIAIEPDNRGVTAMIEKFPFGPGARDEAAKQFTATLQDNPNEVKALFGLCLTTSPDKRDEAVVWCRKAVELAPQDKKYQAALQRRLGGQ